MTINRVKYYYFSPTNTTKKVVEKIARGIGKDIIEENITFIEKNSKEYVNEEDTLVIVGVPVYGGRVPQIILETLRGIKGSGYAVPVVVYGNRAYEGRCSCRVRGYIRKKWFFYFSWRSFYR